MGKQGWLWLSRAFVSVLLAQVSVGWVAPEVDRNQYPVFAQLLDTGQKAEAMKLGDVLFEGVVSRHARHKGLRQLRERLKSASEMSELIVRFLESKRQIAFVDIAELGTKLAVPSVTRSKEAENFMPCAERLYWDNLDIFNGRLELAGLSATDSKLVSQYWALKMEDHIEKIGKVTAQVRICGHGSSSLWHYGLMLSLLCLPERDQRWESFESLLSLADAADMDAMAEFCLLRVERPETAKAIAKYKARSRGKDFSLVDWSVESSSKCVERGRADLAQRLLSAAIGSLSNETKIAELRLRIAAGYSRCYDYAKAAQVCDQTAKQFPDNVLYGRLMCDYFSYLARQSQAERILQSIDSELAKPGCGPYQAELLYLKWWSLRKTGQSREAGAIGRRLIEQFSESRCIAPVLLARATEALSNQQYDTCRELLSRLITKFPHTTSAQKGQEISAKLR
jgi:hypothetical protein